MDRRAASTLFLWGIFSMPEMPYLVKIGNRGIHLRNVTHWRFIRAGETRFPRNQLCVYLTAVDGSETTTTQAYETFSGDEADALMAYLEDMSVDVVLQAQFARERSEQHGRMMAAVHEVQG